MWLQNPLSFLEHDFLGKWRRSAGLQGKWMGAFLSDGCKLSCSRLNLVRNEMMNSLSLFVSIILSFLLVPFVHAQDKDERIPISVSHTGDDSVGKQFAYSVREALRASKGFRLAPPENSGISVRIVTIDPERAADSKSYWTVAAVTYTMTNFIPYQKGNPQTWYPIYLGTHVMTVGSQRVNEQARSVMASIDEILEKYRRDAKE